jgi:hypothetical protein
MSVPASTRGGQGVYVLYDGSMPVYVGKGNIRRRLRGAKRSSRRGQFWDHFSWYIIPDPSLRHDIEAFLLRRLPWYLRGLNQQSGKFRDARKVQERDQKPEPIKRTKPKP